MVNIDNVARFHLDLNASLVGDLKEVKVRINAMGLITAPMGKTVYFKQTDLKWSLSNERYPQGLVKKHGLSGPIQDFFMEHPVLMVYGTSQPRDKAPATNFLDDIVNRLISTGDGSGVLRTGFHRHSDREVYEKDLTEKNLIRFAHPSRTVSWPASSTSCR